ncbi:alpha/beta hydrolase [Undibacterium sp. YM2]|uniref:patatin-like phospholipase family protein n=1 Tax=Undibacterium sp. YM2 TaxID=2058625 RepID=UPI001331F841|nr:patatin-like phospholipase family protein [Undibacterium sp. YM2]BBB64924.1 alpha/beta hydrolase [Undibacterium sp. YM2]
MNKTVTLALQGGGSHGALTWGVLDRLLEDGRVSIEAISGSSAGAMNAVALAHGYLQGGADGARQALKNFWDSVASISPFNTVVDEHVLTADIAAQSELPAAMKHLFAWTRFFSPSQLNPFDINPLRDILAAQIDFERLRQLPGIQLFIATTQVSTGTLKLFRNRQMSLDVLLASACLPMIHRAVEIEGEAYWDGGLTANPPLFPLVHKCKARDIIAILLHAQPRAQIPSSASEIWHRLTEMGFSSTFHTELQGLLLAKREADRGWLTWGKLERRLRKLNLHVIAAPELMSQLSSHSKMNAQAIFLHSLHAEGRARAQVWLDQHFQQLGQQSSFRMAHLFR